MYGLIKRCIKRRQGSFRVKYKNDAKRELTKVIHDLATHPICIKFVSTKLRRHFITDEPTEEMINPVIEAWNNSNGSLAEIHKAVITQAYKYNETTHKFHPPEIWLMQLSRMFDLNTPLSAKKMEYTFKSRPTKKQRQLSWILREIGNSPYRAKQPNGWSDFEVDGYHQNYCYVVFGLLQLSFQCLLNLEINLTTLF